MGHSGRRPQQAPFGRLPTFDLEKTRFLSRGHKDFAIQGEPLFAPQKLFFHNPLLKTFSVFLTR
jgi:hypothetical protein